MKQSIATPESRWIRAVPERGCRRPRMRAGRRVARSAGGRRRDGGVGSGRGPGRLLQAHCPHDVPAALNPPVDATLAAALPATGVQIYTCAIPAAGGAPAWTLKAPHAVLGKKNHDVQAIHFAGPSWQATDGSLVTATRVASSPAPDATNIPWLLLQGGDARGRGRLRAR